MLGCWGRSLGGLRAEPLAANKFLRFSHKKYSFQHIFLSKKDMHLSGLPHLGAVDRWMATPKRARTAQWLLSRDWRIHMQLKILPSFSSYQNLLSFPFLQTLLSIARICRFNLLWFRQPKPSHLRIKFHWLNRPSLSQSLHQPQSLTAVVTTLILDGHRQLQRIHQINLIPPWLLSLLRHTDPSLLSPLPLELSSSSSPIP